MNSAEQQPLAGFDAELDPLAGDVIGDDDACLTQTQEAERLGLDILLMLDSSGSMAQQLPSDAGAANGATKWDAVRQSLEAFVQSPETSDIGVGLQYFPQQQVVCDEPLGLCANLASLCSPSVPCAGGIECLALGSTGCLDSASCDVQSYATPAVDISAAPERAAPQRSSRSAPRSARLFSKGRPGWTCRSAAPRGSAELPPRGATPSDAQRSTSARGISSAHVSKGGSRSDSKGTGRSVSLPGWNASISIQTLLP
jgi:hypothetical protein